MLQRTLPAGFIARWARYQSGDTASGEMWLYEIKHDGFRLIAQTVSGAALQSARQGPDKALGLPGRTPPTLRGEAGGYDSWGISMGNTLHSILIRLVAYVAVVIAAGLLFLAGATVYELMWPRPVVPFSQMSRP